MDRLSDISVETLAAAKGLPADLLRSTFGVADGVYAGTWRPGIPSVAIPYYDAGGSPLFVKHRIATGGRQPAGVPLCAYGLDAIHAGPPGMLVYVVEGESDVWTARLHGLYAVGVPGAASWGAVRARALPVLAGRRVLLWQEPGEAPHKLVCAIARDLPNSRVLTATADGKDFNVLHLRHGARFRAVLAQYLGRAVPITVRAASLMPRIPAPPRRRPAVLVARNAGGYADDRLLDTARARSTVEFLEGRGFRFRGTGLNTVTRCPFPEHQDDSPSFSVHRTSGAWQCFGCGRAGGDAIGLTRQLDGGTFRDAVARVAT